MRLRLSLAGGAHDEPTMLERCAAAACLQLESCIKAVLRMMEGSAEGFSALSKGRDQVAIFVAFCLGAEQVSELIGHVVIF